VQTTLAVPGPTPDMLALDQDGTFVVARGDALLRVDPGTGATATLVALPGLRGVDIDQDTGNYLTGTMTTLLRVDRSTLAITTITAPLTDVRCLAFEPRTGATLVGQLSWLSRVTRAGVVSTVGPPVAASEAVRVDGETGNILGGTGNQVSLLTPSGALVTTRVVLTAFMVTTCVEFYGSRKVSGSGAATPGSSYTIRFAFPSSPGAAYLAVMSTGLRPGLPLPDSSGRVINLDFTSPLFGLSLGGIPGITTGFTGTLSPSGTASGTIAIPPGFPSGLRLFVSAVAVNGAFPSGLETANTWAFTINP
jgi:hypothetical protein